jgi:hypothetical protein
MGLKTDLVLVSLLRNPLVAPLCPPVDLLPRRVGNRPFGILEFALPPPATLDEPDELDGFSLWDAADSSFPVAYLDDELTRD